MVSQILHSRTSRPAVGVFTCPNTSLVSPGPTPNFNLPILPISLYLSPGKLSESSLVQTPHLCLQDSLPTSVCRDILNAHLQASCRSSHLSKHLTCVSRTYSQPQPVEIFSMLISRQVVGVLTCPNTSLVSPGLTPNLSLSRYSKHVKTCRCRQSIDKSHLSNDLTANMPKNGVKQNTSPKSRLFKLFDALDFTSARYQPSVDCKPLVQAQHRSSAKIQELNTNDSSFTLDGVLSTLQQGSAENGVGSSVELRYHVKKRRAQICGQIQRFNKIPTELRRQTRTSTTHTKLAQRV